MVARNEGRVSAAISAVLQLYRWPADLAWRVVSYREQFRSLWLMDERLFCDLESKRERLILVADDRPEQPCIPSIPLNRYLTAIDWAVSASLEYLKWQRAREFVSTRSETIPWRLLVVLPGVNNSDYDSAAHNLFRGEKEGPSAFPWISTVSATHLLAHIPALLDGAPCAVEPKTVTAVQRLWVAELTQPDSTAIRHSIANLVGPRLLIEGMRTAPIEHADRMASLIALDRLLDSVELRADVNGNFPAPWCGRSEWESAGITRFFLVDDMEDLGWSEFLRLSLQLNANELTSIGSNEIPKFLQRILVGQQRRQMEMDSAVIFLDLRLFTRGSWEDEKHVFEVLADHISTRMESHEEPLWPAVGDNELRAIRACVSHSERVEDADYHLALSIFPRLLSLADPTLPIILFSSTGRKEIADRLRPYGNIVLDFMKPRLSGDPPNDVVYETRTRFRAALSRAMELARARRAVRSTRRASAGAAQEKAKRIRPAISKQSIVEVYLDESELRDRGRRKRFAVGGIAVLYPDSASVGALDAALMSNGLVWGLADGHLPLNPADPIPPAFLPKEHPSAEKYEADLRRILDTASSVSAEIRFAGIALVETGFLFQNQSHLPTLLREDYIDNLYRTMLEECINGILIDWLPQIASSDVECHIDVATRLGYNSNTAELQQLHELYGIDLQTKGRGLYFSLGTQEVYPIVARALAQDGSSSPARVTRARATTLFDFKSNIMEFRARVPQNVYDNRILRTYRPKQIHFLADWFSRFAAQRDLVGPLSRSLFDVGFMQERNERQKHWSASAALARSARIPEAIMEGYKALASPEDQSDFPLSRYQLPALGPVLTRIKGEDFMELTRRLRYGL
jgi:hypothetical protein